MLIWSDFQPGGYRVLCPACGTNPRKKNMRVTIDHDGHGVAFCHKCEYTESHTPNERTFIKPAPIGLKTQPVKHETLSTFGLALWADCVPVCGDGLLHLKARRCVIPPEGAHLRYHPALRHPTGYTGPGLVALVTDVLTGDPISLHRTWIKPDGTKADVDPPRMLLGGHRKQGGVIRLWPDEYVSHGLAITEGIETALSLAHAYQPVWSCVDAGNLAAFPVLAGIESLVIGADNDPAGQKAARTCATRWADADREVLVTRQSANDLNDVVKEAAHEC